MIVPEIREYGEEYPVTVEPLRRDDAFYDGDSWKDAGHREGRIVIVAFNEGHYNSTQVDLEDVLRYAAKNHADMLDRVLSECRQS